ncbi:sensor histidine kinase [Sulfurospirillum sp. hDNRA2]|uniref:sensor histidine kinase n=1 Tax=Sulfurospirillum sp. hDNRA2 TaxID=3237298 RepID=UPI0020B881BC|nr:HAMP domain-containing sensor histidine kinase [Sulfurospirillum sp. DNRA8]MCP3651719.1 HAMP domain-containing histidine kinase [Sulfurospirillum sp. DNRA8]MCR1810566.1 HAMP domain-containing histidine kinase [Sulfurospirillum sp. DNRA8]
MIKYLSIRLKFLLMASLGVCSIVTLSFLAFDITQKGVVNVNNVFEGSKRVQTIQQTYILPLFKLREQSLSLIMAPNEDLRKDILRTINAMYQKMDEPFQRLPKNVYDQWQNYVTLIRANQSYLKDDFEEGAFINANTVERDQFYALMDSLDEMQQNELSHASDTFTKANKEANNSRYFIVVWLIVIIVLTLLIGSYIAKNIVDSTLHVSKGLREFFDYLKSPSTEEATRIHIPLNNKDELGDMARRINKNIEIIQANLEQDSKLIEDATNVVEDLKLGNLDRRLVARANSDQLNLLKAVMNEMLDNLEFRIQQEINERTRQEQLLIQQSKLAAMGNMIGNIAHQWRQPLGEINALLMIIQVRRHFEDFTEEFLNAKIEECNRITEYMSNTISDFQNFFKPSKAKEIFDVTHACERASSILQASLKYHAIEFRLEKSEGAQVLGYPNEFAQAILNVLSNAKDVLIERQIEAPYIAMSVKNGKRYTLIKIEDNGGGIAAEHIERIFEPYFTTKHAKQGTGIGLYMTKMIIENNMNGIINVSNTNYGALFTIKLKRES